MNVNLNNKRILMQNFVQKINLKTKGLKNFLSIVLLFVLVNTHVKAQIASWNFFGQNNILSLAATTFSANLETTAGANLITRGAGATSVAGTNSFRTSGFSNDGISTSNTDYFQITLKALSGYQLSITSINAKMAGTPSYAVTPGVSQQFAYSTDGVNFTLIGSPSVTVGQPAILPTINTSAVLALQNVPSTATVTLRYYATGQTAAGGWGFNSTTVSNDGLSIGGSLTTVAPTPTLTSSALPTFATTCPGSTSTQTVSISGVNLTGSAIGVGPYAGYLFSQNIGGPFLPSESLTYSGGTLNATTVYVQFAPTAGGYYIGNIPLSGGGATANIATNAFSTQPIVTVTPPIQNFCGPSSATLTAAGSGVGVGYTWTGGIMDGVSFTASSTQTYTVTATDANSCTATTTAQVNVYPVPTSISLTNISGTPCTNTFANITASGGVSYTWMPGNGSGTSVALNVPTGTTIFTITAVDANACTISSTISMTSQASGNLSQASSGNTSSVTGTSTGTDTQPDGQTMSYYSGSCDLIATIQDAVGGNALGLVQATVNVEPSVPMYLAQPYLRRWYTITPASNGPAFVTLYFTQADFNDYNAANGSFPDFPTTGSNSDPNISHIAITKVSGGALGVGATTVIHPSVNWNGSYWELTFPVTGFSSYYFHGNNGVYALAASITNFTGHKLETSNMLQWTTTSEQNNAYFNIQHSTNGINFTTVEKVMTKASNGNSSMDINYAVEHKNPSAGHNYYRLEQVDMDGHSSLSQQIIDVQWGANGSVVTLYPNPIQDVLHIDVYSEKEMNTTIQLMDISGRIIKQVQTITTKGMNNIVVNLQDISSGMYTVQVLENNKLTQVSKVTKQ